MAEATIPVKKDVKEKIKDEKRENETYNGVLLRLLGESAENYVTEEELVEVLKEFPTDEEARSIARAEAKDMIREFS